MSALHDRLDDLTTGAPEDGFRVDSLTAVAHRRLRRRRLRTGGVACLAAAVVAAGVAVATIPGHGPGRIEPAHRVVQVRFDNDDVVARKAPELTADDYTEVYSSPVIAGDDSGEGVAAMLSDGRALLKRDHGTQWGRVDDSGAVRWWPQLPDGGRADVFAGTLRDGRIVLADRTAHPYGAGSAITAA